MEIEKEANFQVIKLQKNVLILCVFPYYDGMLYDVIEKKAAPCWIVGNFFYTFKNDQSHSNHQDMR